MLNLLPPTRHLLPPPHLLLLGLGEAREEVRCKGLHAAIEDMLDVAERDHDEV
jgi:hypothetical protein